MEPSQVQQLILAGEDPSVEFKEQFTTAVDREMVAMLNAGGGAILIGVSDDGAIVGLQDSPRQLEERVMGLCRTNVHPSFTPAVQVVSLPEGTVLVLDVPKGQQKPYTANGVCYVRAGSTTRRARPEELRALSFETEYTRFERTTVSGFVFEDLNLARLQDYVERRAPGSIHVNGLRLSDVAVSWGLAVRKGESVLPTVAGVMLFGLQPQRLSPQWGIGAVRLAGTALSDPILDRADLEGTVDQLVDAALAFVRRNMRVAAEFPEDEARRRDLPEYPLAAVREALTNAVVHRDYGRGGRVMLRMFEDRLETQNPGSLPQGLTLQEVTRRGGFSYPRNPTLARVMRDWGRVEEVGRGLLRIRREMEALGSEAPVFESAHQVFQVLLPSRHRSGRRTKDDRRRTASRDEATK
jgi:ATP-dependent DNA helicase RecG